MENTVEDQHNLSSDTEPQQSNNELDLLMVDWKPYYILSKASIGQIMMCFTKILNVVPKNTYELKLYEYLKPSTTTLISEFKKLLIYDNDIERDILFYNLIINLPKTVSVNDEEDGLIKLRSAKIGYLIKAIKQRIKFIQERDIPQRYVNNLEQLEKFNSLRSNINNFNSMVCIYESEFIVAIDQAHRSQQEEFNTNTSTNIIS